MFNFNPYENEYFRTLDTLFKESKSFEEKKEILSLQKEFIEKMQEFELKWLAHILESKKQDDTYYLERSKQSISKH